MNSAIYENRPAYADYDSAAKFQAIQSIIASKLTRYPNAICSYSGGADSDIVLDLIERTRAIFGLKPVKYVFFNTGLEMEATKRHVKEVAEKYGIEIETIRPKKNIVLSTREHGLPFVSKIHSQGLESLQRKGIPFSVADEYHACQTLEEKKAKRAELDKRYPGAKSALNFLCECTSDGEPRPGIQLGISSSAYMLDFLKENPPRFKISAKCCDDCKKSVAKKAQKGYDMIITGERRDEGGMRSVPRQGVEANQAMCFTEQANGQYRFKPIYYVSDKDKSWYKEEYGIRYSDAYEVYGLKRTGCCGCSISARAVEDLEIIGKYEPQLKKAAWAVFGDSYRYRQAYIDYRAKRRAEEKRCKP